MVERREQHHALREHEKRGLRGDLFGFVLLMASLLAIAWQHFGMNRTFVIEPGDSHTVWVENDSGEGGNSIVSLSDADGLRMDCQIRTAISFPHCNLLIGLGDPIDTGVDLSGFSSLYLELSQESTIRDSVRVSLNHFFRDAEQPENALPFKAHQRVFNASNQRVGYELQLADFYVPAWWVYANNLPAKASTSDLSNVHHLVFSPGDIADERLTSITLYRAEFRGKWLTVIQLYRLLVWVWISWLIVYLMTGAVILKRKLRKKRQEAAQLAKLNRKLGSESKKYEKMAMRDELTGALNRNGLNGVLENSIRTYFDNEQPFSILLLDLDHFKVINDDYGHAEGDRILKELVDVISRRKRNSDFIARWGGEEFLVVCDNTTIDQAYMFAEVLRKQIAAHAFLSERPVTCSIGVAEMFGADIELAFQSADEALYKAKAGGRNRTEAYRPA